MVLGRHVLLLLRLHLGHHKVYHQVIHWPNTQLQFNFSGSLRGDTALTWNTQEQQLRTGALTISASTKISPDIDFLVTSSIANFRLQGSSLAKYSMRADGGESDAKAWQWVTDGNVLYLGCLNDSEDAELPMITFHRDGQSPIEVTTNTHAKIEGTCHSTEGFLCADLTGVTTSIYVGGYTLTITGGIITSVTEE